MPYVLPCCVLASQMSNKLLNKVAVVTGGNSGIGLASAQLFEKHGARMAIFGRDPDSLEKVSKNFAPGTVTFAGDISSSKDVDEFYEKVKETFGRIDIVFANAGISESALLPDVTDEFFDRIINTNVRGVLYTIQKALPLFGTEGGSIILNSSVQIGKNYGAVILIRDGAPPATLSIPVMEGDRRLGGRQRDVSYPQAISSDLISPLY